MHTVIIHHVPSSRVPARCIRGRGSFIFPGRTRATDAPDGSDALSSLLVLVVFVREGLPAAPPPESSPPSPRTTCAHVPSLTSAPTPKPFLRPGQFISLTLPRPRASYRCDAHPAMATLLAAGSRLPHLPPLQEIRLGLRPRAGVLPDHRGWPRLRFRRRRRRRRRCPPPPPPTADPPQ